MNLLQLHADISDQHQGMQPHAAAHAQNLGVQYTQIRNTQRWCGQRQHQWPHPVSHSGWSRWRSVSGKLCIFTIWFPPEDGLDTVHPAAGSWIPFPPVTSCTETQTTPERVFPQIPRLYGPTSSRLGPSGPFSTWTAPVVSQRLTYPAQTYFCIDSCLPGGFSCSLAGVTRYSLAVAFSPAAGTTDTWASVTCGLPSSWWTLEVHIHTCTQIRSPLIQENS